MTEYLNVAEIRVPKASEALAQKFIDKILELCVRTDHITSDVLRAGSYIHGHNTHDFRHGSVVMQGHYPEIEMVVVDAHAHADDFADPASFIEDTPRFYLATTVLSGAYDIESEPYEKNTQQPVERITLSGGPIESRLAPEVDGKVKDGHPLILEYRMGEGDADLDLSGLSPEELTETVNALLLSFWVRYGLASLDSKSEIWAELHLTEEEHEAAKWDYILEESDTDPDEWDWVEAISEDEPSEDPISNPWANYSEVLNLEVPIELQITPSLEDDDAPREDFDPNEREGKEIPKEALFPLF